jgi:hypothetical protein
LGRVSFSGAVGPIIRSWFFERIDAKIAEIAGSGFEVIDKSTSQVVGIGKSILVFAGNFHEFV